MYKSLNKPNSIIKIYTRNKENKANKLINGYFIPNKVNQSL